MIRRPPRPTLFPSTTLSRSERPEHERQDVGRGREAVVDDYPEAARTHRLDVNRAQEVARVALAHASRIRGAADLRGWDAPQLDRKSTRLNSSHSQISYAVFC